MLALPDISQEVIDRPIDAILPLNLFEVPRDTVEMLTAYVASFGTHPVSPQPRTHYHEAAACLDFGSLACDTAIFPRTLEILKRDSPLFGPVEADLTFGDGEEAVRRLTALRGDPDRRWRLRAAAHRDWAFDRLSLERILPDVLAGECPASSHTQHQPTDTSV
ncbi:hypothetical protein [Azospirillum brasilense]|uniref:hypothetical protein n=1 Tax=Azospirillum brasilense TaxID=192 RepID=UPI001FFF4FBA|nr:hypothetical protein [Azospirillum brasilense]